MKTDDLSLNKYEQARLDRITRISWHKVYDIGRSEAGRLLVYVESSINDPDMKYVKYIIGKRGGYRCIYSSMSDVFEGRY